MRRFRRPRDERGAIAIVMAAALTGVLVVTALVLDFGLVRVDRQVDKSAADSAVLAGLQDVTFGGATAAHPYVGVCSALRYLKANNERFASISETTGWKNGSGAVVANGCSDATLRAASCVPGDPSTWAVFEWSGSWQGQDLSVRIQSGYSLAASGWAEDSLPASAADVGDAAKQGCDQLAVVITQHRKPGLGSIATSDDLVSSVRSVGRVKLGPNGYAPAMLLLKRSGCDPNPLTVGGSGSYIHVMGVVGSSGTTQPGTIHSDDDGGSCASSGGKQIFNGATADGIVAYAAPVASNPTSPDPTKPGVLSSVAGSLGVALPVVRDSLTDAYGASGLDAATPGTKLEATNHSLVTRQPVDARYLSTVRSIASNAAAKFGLAITSSATAAALGWGYASCNSSGSVASYDAYDATKNGLFVNCSQVTSLPGSAITGWRTVVFSGSIKASGSTAIKLPDARKVYIAGSSSAATDINGGGSFQMHTTGRTGPASFVDGQRCLSTTTTDRALLVVNRGALTNNGLFRACDTTVVMLGSDSGGCLPTYNPVTQSTAPANLPTHSPCSSTNNGGAGTGQLYMNGQVDWTAPNQCAQIKDTSAGTVCDGVALSATQGWHDVSGPEDLALWTESAAYGSINGRIGGSSDFSLRGIFMTPNFDAMVLGGGPSTALINAQFIASALNLNGGAQLKMTVDPDSAVTLPNLVPVGLVR